jgi:ABC-type lipoprotein export system ATPase subunit
MLDSLIHRAAPPADSPGLISTRPGQPVIRLNQVVKTFVSAAGSFTVLHGISATFLQGEFVGVIGKSGSGKSTLINMMTGIDRPSSGEVFIGDVAVHGLTENEMAIWRGRNMGIVFQFFQLLPMLSLAENVMLPMDFCELYAPRQRRARALDLLRLVDMEDHADKLPTAISGGQQQRVAIARALANDPPIVVADEPTGNLDSHTAESVYQLFESLVRQGKTIVMVTHDSAMARRVDRTLLLADGEVVNNWVARALPSLTHQQMLHATRELKPMHFTPGQRILREAEPSDRFYIITSGRVEIALQRPGGTDVAVTQMGPGEYFGEIELLRGGGNLATIRAKDGPVDVIALDGDDFMDLLGQSDSTRQALEHMAQLRTAENLAARGTPA